jgi:hypothetical protein
MRTRKRAATGSMTDDRHAEYTHQLHHPGAADKLRRTKGQNRANYGCLANATRRQCAFAGWAKTASVIDAISPMSRLKPSHRSLSLLIQTNQFHHAHASQPDCNIGATLAGADMCIHIYFLSYLRFSEAD